MTHPCSHLSDNLSLCCTYMILDLCSAGPESLQSRVSRRNANPHSPACGNLIPTACKLLLGGHQNIRAKIVLCRPWNRMQLSMCIVSRTGFVSIISIVLPKDPLTIYPTPVHSTAYWCSINPLVRNVQTIWTMVPLTLSSCEMHTV